MGHAAHWQPGCVTSIDPIMGILKGHDTRISGIRDALVTSIDPIMGILKAPVRTWTPISFQVTSIDPIMGILKELLQPAWQVITLDVTSIDPIMGILKARLRRLQHHHISRSHPSIRLWGY